MECNRRAFLGGSILTAMYPCAAALAAKPNPAADLILSFEDAGGSILNSGIKNNRAYSNAIKYLSRRGGGTLVIPEKVYPFSGASICDATNVTVLGYGATFAGDNCRLTINIDSNGYNIQGLTLLETSGTAESFLLDCYGSNSHLKDLHLEKSPPAGGYIAYCRDETSGFLFENVSFSGSNGIFLAGHDHEVRGGWAEAYHGDDCWVLKSTVYPCYNIHISGFQARAFTAIVSIGSEIGTPNVDNPDRNLFVKNVIVEDCSADACTYLAYIKPGGNQAVDYRDGFVEDITIRNCQLNDTTGMRFRDGVYISPGRGAIVRGVTLQNLTINARGANPAVQNIAGVYLQVLNSTDGAGIAGSIEDVSVSGLRCTDPFGGAANSGLTPGTPLQSLVAIEKQDPAIGDIGRVDVADSTIDGCARMAVSVGTNVAGPLSFTGCSFNNYAAAILASIDKGSVFARSPIALNDITAVPSPNARPGTRGIMADSHPDKTVKYVGDVTQVSSQIIPAGTSASLPIYSAARDSWISMVEILVGQTIPLDNVDFVQFTLRNGGNGQVLATANSTTDGLLFTEGSAVSVNGPVEFSGAAAYLAQGAQLLIEVSHGGQGATVVDPTFIVHSVPYGVT